MLACVHISYAILCARSHVVPKLFHQPYVGLVHNTLVQLCGWLAHNYQRAPTVLWHIHPIVSSLIDCLIQEVWLVCNRVKTLQSANWKSIFCFRQGPILNYWPGHHEYVLSFWFILYADWLFFSTSSCPHLSVDALLKDKWGSNLQHQEYLKKKSYVHTNILSYFLNCYCYFPCSYFIYISSTDEYKLPCTFALCVQTLIMWTRNEPN